MRLRKTKFLAALLAVVMMFSLVTQAFAVEVSNTLQGDTSTATETSQTGRNNTGPSEEELPIEEQFITAGKQLLADWAELTDDEKETRSAAVTELMDELYETTDEEEWSEDVYTILIGLADLSGGAETMWVGGASDRYQKFALFSLTEQPWDYGWNRKIPQSTIDNAAKYIYPRTYSVTYNGAETYIGYVQMFIKPGAYSLNLTEAGELAGGKWDATVSSGKNYTYTAKSGNPRVEKVTVDTGYGSDWTYINLSNLKLGDVIQVNAYQCNYYLKVGNPMVKIYRDSVDVTGRNIQVDAGETINLNAMGFLEENVTAAGPITFSSSNTSLATVDSRGTVKILGEGTVTITASWVSNNGYFNASNKVTFNVEDPAKRVASISVKDYQPTYHWNETFNKQQGTIVATMGDGSTKEVPLASASDIYGFSSDAIGQKTITVWYEGCKATFPVTVAYEPAKISVAVTDPAKYGQTKTGKITVTGDADFVTLPDGTKVKPDDLTDYVFPNNGTYKFTVTGMDGGTDNCTVNISVIDKEAPSLTVSYTGGKLSISTQDNLSGIHTIEYVDEVFTESTAAKWVSSPKTITDTLTGVADGIYGVVVTDHAGNSKSYDFKVGGTTTTKPDFSVYVPSNIVLVINEDGTVAQAPSDAKIYNGVETLPICVTGIKVTTSQGWSLVDYNTNFTDADKDAKKLALSINGVPVPANGTVTVDRNAWTIPKNGSIDLDFQVKAPDQTEKKTLNNVVKVTYDVDWYDSSLTPGNRYTVSLQNVSNATIKGTARTLYTDVYGRVPALPRVTPNTYYAFNGWIRTDTNARVKVGDVIDKNVTLKPVIGLAPGYIIVNFNSAGNGKVDQTSAIVASGSKFGDIAPTVTPDAGYEFFRWSRDGGWNVYDTDTVTSGSTYTANFTKKIISFTQSYVYSSYGGNTGSVNSLCFDGSNFITLYYLGTQYSDNYYLGIGTPSSDSGRVSFSSGDCFYRRGSSDTYKFYYRDAVHGNGIYVAVASNRVAYSTDGKTWSFCMPSSDLSTHIAYGGGKFVVAGSGENLYSSNGSTWYSGNLSSGSWSGIAYGAGKFVTIDGKNKKAAYSSNGISWSTYTLPVEKNGNSWGDINYSDGMFTITSKAQFAYSTDGRNWTVKNLPEESYTGRPMTYGNGIFMGILYKKNSSSDYVSYAIYSDDKGNTWTTKELMVKDRYYDYLNRIVYGAGRFILTGSGGTLCKCYCSSLVN